MQKNIFTFCSIFAFVVICGVSAQNEDNDGNNTDTSTAMPITSTSTPKNISCEVHNNDCNACVERSQCYYCSSTDECHYHIDKAVVEGVCDVTHMYLFTCKANVKIMLIIIGVLSGIAFLMILIVCCYCCCKKKGVKLSKDDIKWARQREERKQIAAERRKERAERTDEIRKKYGLVKNSNPYQRFDA